MTAKNNISNADQFLNIFHDVEHYLKNKYNNGYYESFVRLVREASKVEHVFRRYKDDLMTYADLRNAIVHNKRYNGVAIAEPHDEVLIHFQKIWKEISLPLKASHFNRQVYYCKFDDPLKKALDLMHKHMISQIPILNYGKLVDVLNGNCIAHWLASEHNPNIDETPIQTVLDSAEYSGNYDLISESTSVYEAADIYRKSFKQPPVNWYYDALIITKHGLAAEKMTGIIVLADIAEYLHE
ncbi:CBS domain-containing protein [Prolixibacteraceae bacterium JC049]|nr:CBS domain-containing protein [Prolixibacteraceae bacterium JC049]